MCSWCWGFAPVIETIADRYETPVEVVVGGLRPGPAAEPLDSIRPYLTKHWVEIAERTGQPFDLAGLDRQDWVYDTEMAARAVVSVRQTVPDKTLEAFTRIQRAFYAEAVDVTDANALAPIFSELEATAALPLFESDESKTLAWDDFGRARSLGINGFPGLLVFHDDSYQIVTRGYVAGEQLLPLLDDWMTEQGLT
jgi:putative protein-disulfide isomerase